MFPGNSLCCTDSMVANRRQSSIGQGQTSSSFRFRAGGMRPQPAASERHGCTKSWLELFKFAASADLAKTHQQYSTLAQQSQRTGQGWTSRHYRNMNVHMKDLWFAAVPSYVRMKKSIINILWISRREPALLRQNAQTDERKSR